VGTFLLVVNDDHASILHGYGDAGLQRFWNHDLDLLGSREVIGQVTIRLGVSIFLLVVNDDHAPILHGYRDMGLQKFYVTEILGPKHNGVTSLTFWGHVTSSVT